VGRHEEDARDLLLERDPAAVGGAGNPVELPCTFVGGEQRAGRTASGGDLEDRAAIFGTADIENALAVWTPGRRVRVGRQAPCGASERGHDPEVAAIRADVARERAADADETRSRRPRRDECDRVAVGGERGLYVLTGVVRDVDVLASLSAAHEDVVVALPVGGV